MIYIKQTDKVDKKVLGAYLEKLGKTKYNLDCESIGDDIKKLKDRRVGLKGNKLINIDRVIKYLELLLKEAKKGEFSSMWVLNGNKVESIPIEIRDVKMFGINVNDYIRVGDKRIITIDYSSVLDLMTFEISYRDFGYTMDEVEDKLKGLSSLAVYPMSKIEELLDKNEYEVGLSLMVEDTPYISVDISGNNKNDMYDYFGNLVDESKYYTNMLKSSRDIIMSIILTNILGRILEAGKGVEILGVFESGISLRVDSDISKLIDTVVIRVFGRKFEVEPKVEIY